MAKTPLSATTPGTGVDRALDHLPWRLVSAVLMGTLLNPLNSSMIAVALLSLRSDFRVSATTVGRLGSCCCLPGALGCWPRPSTHASSAARGPDRP